MTTLQMRELTASDIENLEGIHRSNCQFPFPDFQNQLYCCNKVVVDDHGEIIGMGAVRLTSESILIMDKSRPTTMKARAIKMLVTRMKSEVQALGMDETHAFVDDKDSCLRRLLKQVFGFVECQARSVYLQF